MFRGQELTTRPLKEPEIRRSVGAIALERRTPTPPAKELLARLAEEFRRATGEHR
jgi:hypothetical protein